MICQHQTADTMRRLHVRGLASQSDLNRGWTPGNELSETTLTDTEKGFVHLYCEQTLA